MFENLINRILGAEQKPSPSRLDNNIAEPGVSVSGMKNEKIKLFVENFRKKYRKDAK